MPHDPMSRPRATRQAVRSLAVVLALAAALVCAAPPAFAHISLTGSEPANLSTVPGPVTTIRLTYTKPCEPVVDKFALTGPDGTSLPITSVANDGPATIVVTPAAALPAGRSKVAWSMRAGDSHVMNGTVAFTVAGQPATSAAPAPAAAPTKAAAPTTAAEPATTAAAPTVATGTTGTTGAAAPAPATAAVAASLPEPSGTIAALARWLTYGAVLFCVGGLGYLAWVHKGTRTETRMLVFWMRRAAVLVLIGAIVEWFAQLMLRVDGAWLGLVSPRAWGGLLTSSVAIGTVLRLAGAGLVLGLLRMDVVTERMRRIPVDPDPDPGGATSGGASGGGTGPALAERRAPADDPGRSTALLDRTPPEPRTRLRLANSPFAFVGAALLVLSEAFLGHTADTEPWLLVVVADATHLVAGGIWAAGAFMLAAVLGSRRRRHVPLDAAYSAVRFSIVATWALVAVTVSGVALAWCILDSWSALVTTGFGQVLLAKVAVVAVIAGLGAYNHWALVPRLADGASPAELALARVITTEAGLFAVVLGLTAFLVAASPV